jgi:lysylphosphatidylglycerol synthetase-like protein (DUF2156 family)
MAWLLTVVVLIIPSVSHLLKSLDYEEAILAAGLVLWLWFLRHHFHARGVVGFYLLDRHFSSSIYKRLGGALCVAVFV